MRNFFKTIARDQQGATAIEYGLIAALISVAAIAALTNVGQGVDATFDKVAEEMPVTP